MALPKIEHPTFELTVPSTKKKIKLRPMLVKEEKILLIGKSSGEKYDILNAIKQVVNNCIVTQGFDIESLAIFDLEFLFIKLRAISVSNVTKVSYKDNEDEQQYDIDINLDNVSVDMSTAPDTKITVNKNLLLELSWPMISVYTSKELYEAPPEKIFDILINNCLSKIYQGETVFDAKTSTAEEKQEFIDNLPTKAGDQLRAFLTAIPTLKHTIEYTNSKGTKREIVLDTLDDFFTL